MLVIEVADEYRDEVEVLVTGAFAPGAVEPRRPLEAGDIDNRTWWIEVIDDDNSVIMVQCD